MYIPPLVRFATAVALLCTVSHKAFLFEGFRGKLFQVVHAAAPGEIIGGGLLRMLRSGGPSPELERGHAEDLGEQKVGDRLRVGPRRLKDRSHPVLADPGRRRTTCSRCPCPGVQGAPGGKTTIDLPDWRHLYTQTAIYH